MTAFKTSRATSEATTRTTETHVDDDHAVPSVPQRDSWMMATSILVGLDKAIKQAETERNAALAKGNNNPFAPGVSTPTQIAQALIEARRVLAPQLHATAKSSGLPMPEGV